MLTFRVLAALLAYPETELIASLDEAAAIIESEGLLPPRQRAPLLALIERLRAEDLLDSQERYVALFDRRRSLSLHLYEHVHGESRDRGQAMVRLAHRLPAAPGIPHPADGLVRAAAVAGAGQGRGRRAGDE